MHSVSVVVRQVVMANVQNLKNVVHIDARIYTSGKTILHLGLFYINFVLNQYIPCSENVSVLMVIFFGISNIAQ